MTQNPNRDVEKGSHRPEFLDGYPSLAAFIASDKELAIYRSFDRLSARNLLYAQSELLYLEARLDALDKEDQVADFQMRASARSWRKLHNPITDHDKERLECILSLRQALERYRR